MNNKLILGFFAVLFVAVAVMAVFFLHDKELAVLHPKGMIGLKERDLLVIATLLMLIVVIPTLILAFAFAWRYRAGKRKAKYDPDWDHHDAAEIIWWTIPFIIIVILSVITWKGCLELDPFKPIESENPTIKIQVVALDWKWLFIYPEENIATVNFFQIPEQTPIEFEITADAPMNSFWLPQLGGQIFAMSGMKTKLHLIADESGEFRGSSANISGAGFSGMTFTAKACSEEDFEEWVASVKESNEMLDIEEYEQLAKPSEYVPPLFYSAAEEGLFDWIVMKYMMPSED